MKTAISIPDPIFQAADSLANRLGVSRSELYSKAIAAFIEQNKNFDVTARLNQIFSTENNSLDDDYRNLQQQSLNDEKWWCHKTGRKYGGHRWLIREGQSQVSGGPC